MTSVMRPGRADITTTRVERKTASGIEWVTKTTVVPVRSQIRSSSRFIRSRVISSSAPNGSSISRMAGSRARARAMATRCCIPPDSCQGRWRPNSESSTSARSSRARACRSALGRRITSSGSSTLRSTVRQSKRTGAWKTIPYSRPRRASWAGLPLTVTVPRVGPVRSPIKRRSVDLPQPDGPIRVTNSPRRIARSIPWSATTRPPWPLAGNSLSTPLAWTTTSAAGRGGGPVAVMRARPPVGSGRSAPSARPTRRW